MSEPVVVRNAADRDQVKRAARRDVRQQDARRALIEHQLSTAQGRAFVWGELERHHLFESITVQSSMIYALSGRRDAGLELLAEVERFPELYLLMQTEAIQRAARDAREVEAGHTQSAQARSDT